MKIAIYTCITGRYDALKPPLVALDSLDLYCVTDVPEIVVPPWTYVPIDLPGMSAKDLSRFIKMHPAAILPNYDATVYIDGSIQIVGDLEPLIAGALRRGGELFAYEHPLRDCIYAEAATCVECAHDWIWTVSSQMRRYREEGYPTRGGLFEAGVLIRRDTDIVRQVMQDWWCEYVQGAKRDQLSLPYVCWKSGFRITSLGKSDPRFRQRYFRLNHHAAEGPGVRRWGFALRKHVNGAIARAIPHAALFGPAVPRYLIP